MEEWIRGYFLDLKRTCNKIVLLTQRCTYCSVGENNNLPSVFFFFFFF
jgi:hypothetical protein